MGDESEHFNGKTFFVPGRPFEHTLWDVIKWRFSGKRTKWPKAVPAVHPKQPTNVDGVYITYIGHATALLQTPKYNILTDPQFSLRTGPFALGPTRTCPPGIAIEDLPKIDAIFISHNHYDHLDLPSIEKLWARDKPVIITPLGNEKTIASIDPQMNITVLDWGQEASLSEEICLKLLPTQHWSGRMILDRNKALWGGACFYIEDKTIVFVGDTGFNKALFQKIKMLVAKPPDAVLAPIGSYAPRWFMSFAHMNPEEAWHAFNILEGKRLIPIHYDVFQLGDEPYGEALQRLRHISKDDPRVFALKPGEGLTITI